MSQEFTNPRASPSVRVRPSAPHGVCKVVVRDEEVFLLQTAQICLMVLESCSVFERPFTGSTCSHSCTHFRI